MTGEPGGLEAEGGLDGAVPSPEPTRPDDLEGAPDVTATRKPWWRRLVGPAIGLAVVAATFGFVLPKVADYASVWATIQTLSWAGVALLVVVSAWNLASVGPVLMTAFPGLRFWEAMTVAQAGTSASSALPGGEVVAYGLVYRMYRSFRLSTGEVATGMVVSGMFDNIAKFSMPVIAFVCVRITGDNLRGLGPVAVIGFGLLVASIVVGIASLRSEAFARRFGDWVGRVTARPLGWIRRPPLEHVGAKVEEFRRGSIGLLRSRWGLLLLGAYLSELSVYLVLLVSLRLVGVTPPQVSWSVVLASFALVRILQSVPITPGGVGVVELGLTAALVAAGGDHAGVVAGVLLYRAFTWLPPLFTGPFFYLGWRRWLRRNHIDADFVAPDHAELTHEAEQIGEDVYEQTHDPSSATEDGPTTPRSG